MTSPLRRRGIFNPPLTIVKTLEAALPQIFEGEKAIMKMTVDFDRCKGCALCTTACPKKIVEMQSEKLNKEGFYTSICIDQDSCIACAMCAIICPDCAITINSGGGKKYE
jgi:2-oxoglutarate ferredoxin oxidoreductase subunit delta